MSLRTLLTVFLLLPVDVKTTKWNPPVTAGVQVGANVHVSHLAYADDITILSSSYSEMQGLLEAVNHHTVTVGKRINASEIKVMPAVIPGEQRQAILLDCT